MNLTQITQKLTAYYDNYTSENENHDLESTIDDSLLKLSTNSFIELMKKVKSLPNFYFEKDKATLSNEALKWYLDEDRMIVLASKIAYAFIQKKEDEKYQVQSSHETYNFELIDKYFLNPIIGKKQLILQELFLCACATTELDEIKRYLKEGALINVFDLDKLPVNCAAWNASNIDCLIYLINQGGHFWYKKADTFHTEILDVYKAVQKYINSDIEYDKEMKAKFKEAHTMAKIKLEKSFLEKTLSKKEKDFKKPQKI